jgi:hypothetical protein
MAKSILLVFALCALPWIHVSATTKRFSSPDQAIAQQLKESRLQFLMA